VRAENFELDLVNTEKTYLRRLVKGALTSARYNQKARLMLTKHGFQLIRIPPAFDKVFLNACSRDHASEIPLALASFLDAVTLSFKTRAKSSFLEIFSSQEIRNHESIYISASYHVVGIGLVFVSMIQNLNDGYPVVQALNHDRCCLKPP
jgi:hypothetical protein